MEKHLKHKHDILILRQNHSKQQGRYFLIKNISSSTSHNYETKARWNVAYWWHRIPINQLERFANLKYFYIQSFFYGILAKFFLAHSFMNRFCPCSIWLFMLNDNKRECSTLYSLDRIKWLGPNNHSISFERYQ